MVIAIVPTWTGDVSEGAGRHLHCQVSVSSRQSGSNYNPASIEAELFTPTVLMFYITGFTVLFSTVLQGADHWSVVFMFSLADLHRTHPSIGQSKQRAAYLLHLGKHAFKLPSFLSALRDVLRAPEFAGRFIIGVLSKTRSATFKRLCILHANHNTK